MSQITTASPTLPRAFYWSLLATVLFAMGMTVLIPIIPLFITDELGAAENWVGTATLSIATASVILRIPAGAFSDRQGRRKIMLIGALIGVVASALYVFAHSLSLFLLARVMTGAGLAMFTTAGKALAVDLAPAPRRGEAIGLYNAAFSLASVVSPMLGEGLKNAAGFQVVFALNGLLMAGALAVTFTLPARRPERSTSPSARGDVTQTLRQRGTWAAILLMLSLGTILAVMYTFYPLMAERMDFYADAPRLLSSVAIGFGLSIWALTNTVIEPVAGRLSDRIGRLPVAAPGLLIILAGLLMLGRANTTASAYLGVALLSFGWSLVHAMADSISQDALPPVLRGMGAAVVYLCFDLAVGASAQVLGGLIDGDDFSRFFSAALVAVGVPGLIGLLLSTRLITYEQRTAIPLTPPVVGD